MCAGARGRVASQREEEKDREAGEEGASTWPASACTTLYLGPRGRQVDVCEGEGHGRFPERGGERQRGRGGRCLDLATMTASSCSSLS